MERFFFGFCYPEEQHFGKFNFNPSNRAMTFKSPQTFHWFSSHLIFSCSSYIIAYVSFILAAWGIGADGKIFPVWSSTHFKLTFNESMNRCHSSALYSWPNTFIAEETLLQKKRTKKKTSPSSKEEFLKFDVLISENTYLCFFKRKISSLQYGVYRFGLSFRIFKSLTI